MSTSVASVVSHFPSAENGFTTTTSGSVSSGATTVGLNSVAGYTNGEVAVFVIDPSNASKQTFTGTIDTSGVQVTNVVWTAGTNTTHASGATVVDYATATHISMMTKGILKFATQAGLIDSQGVANFQEHIDMVDGKAIRDGNDNELIKMSQTTSAVNEFTVKNAATGNPPDLQATGGDTNISIKVTPKGTGNFLLPEGKTAGLIRDRQGGTTGDGSWNTKGTDNTDTSAKAVFMVAGSRALSTSGTDVAITFPQAFTYAPLVIATVQSAGSANVYCTVNNVTTSGCNIRAVGADGSNEHAAWVAIGQ